jgi:REP element-mobilizing transposase RayT
MPYDPNRHHRRSIRLRGYDYRQPGAYFVTICAHGRQHLFGAIDGDTLRPNDAGHMVSRWWGELGAKFPAVIPDVFVVMPDHFHGIVMIGAPGDIDANDVGGDANDVGGYTNPPLPDDIVANDVGGDANDVGGYANPPLPDDIDADDVDGNANDAGGYANPPLPDDIDANDVGSDANDAGGYANPPLRDDADVWTVEVDSYIGPRRSPVGRDNPSVNSDSNAASLSHIIQWFKIMTTTDYIRHVKQSGWSPFDRRVWQRGYYERIIRDERELHAVRRYIAGNPARWAACRDDLDALLARMEERI